jgi:hypothetical protein
MINVYSLRFDAGGFENFDPTVALLHFQLSEQVLTASEPSDEYHSLSYVIQSENNVQIDVSTYFWKASFLALNPFYLFIH